MKDNTTPRRRFLKQAFVSTAAVVVGKNLLAAERDSSNLNKIVIIQPLTDVRSTIRRPSVPNLLPEISWDTLRCHFRISFDLDPSPNTTWEAIKRENSLGATGEYKNGDYLLKVNEKNIAEQIRVISYEMARTDGKFFQIRTCVIECKTSYSGVYKIFTPCSMSQQNYHVDLPFRIKCNTNAESNQPVVWMQQTNGQNTLALGLLDQVSITEIDGSTYDTGNGGEAPGIANSFARVTLKRAFPNGMSTLSFKDSLYLNADPGLNWFEALEGYSAAVDVARDFKVPSVSKWALNPMWHSWYAHADKVNERKIRDDARRARELGVTTIELDAGWNIPSDAAFSFDSDGDYTFDSGRFPDARGMIEEIHSAGQRFILHVSPLLMGKDCKAWTKMKDCKIMVNGKPDAHLDQRLKKVHDYLLTSWENMFTQYHVDGLWYDFLEIPDRADPPASGMEVVSSDLHVAYTKLMQALYNKSIEINPDAVIILRRAFANLNAKTFCTHVWPMDTPQDYNMNRRDIVYMKTFGPGVLTHACCTSWAISETDVNVARQMASIVLAGVPAFSVILATSPTTHNLIIKAWLTFYESNKHALMLGKMMPLLPTPPSAALRIESEKEAFFGFFEAVPGLIEVTHPVDKITLINAFNKRTATYLEGVKGTWLAKIYDQTWHLINKTTIKTMVNGLNINFIGTSECHAIILTKKL